MTSLTVKSKDIESGGHILKVERPVQIVFQDLEYSIPIKQKKNKGGKKIDDTEPQNTKAILKKVNGVFESGKLTAVMGASGAGKTSLLNVIAGNTAQGSTLNGQILLNGEKVAQSQIKGMSGFVFQDDEILGTMTVKEALTMSAKLRLPKDTPLSEKMARVEDIIATLQLEHCVDTIVGNTMIKGISGGERKRLAIGMEMITNPDILYLDEPTSGLDTYTAASVVSTLKELALAGRTIIATIHQPSSEIFHSFDNLILMGHGEVLYHGAIHDVVDYFAKLGFECPTYTNPADYIFMSILNAGEEEGSSDDAESETSDEVDLEGGSPTSSTSGVFALKRTASSRQRQAKERMEYLTSSWKDSDEAASVLSTVDSPATGGVRNLEVSAKANFIEQFHVLMGRALRNLARHKLIGKVRVIQSIMMGLIVGLIYLGVGDNQAGIQDRNGALFLLAMMNFMNPLMGVLSIFAAEKAIFVREYRLGMYSLPAYFWSKMMVELPLAILAPTILVCVAYYTIGFQPDAEHLFLAVVTIVLLANSGQAIGMLIASMFDHLEVALSVAPAIFLPIMIFSGFFLNSTSTPDYFVWIQWISPINYGYKALMVNEYDGLSFHCDDSELVQIGGNQICPRTTGEQVLQSFDMDGESIPFNILMTFVIYVACTGLAYFALWKQTRKYNSNKA
eukprot:GFYU01000172.1.p1 GENE.GFYU01000172.1~~GFYU01000172.1.p1  ORF type:complete len:677 (+),score=259.76 GFYU01000172.1:101-2131(+)